VKTHDRDYFVKYMTSNTAKRILESLQVKWSSPLLFNDPFDIQIDLRFDFDDDQLVRALKDEVNNLVYGTEEPQGDNSNLFFRMLKILRSIRDHVLRSKFESEMEDAIKEGAGNLSRALSEEASKWRSVLEYYRVFCVAEDHGNLLMWSHYSDMHKGAVMRFKCIPELDTALCAAIPVIYQTDMPVLANLHDWIKHITGQVRIDFKPAYYKYVSTKSQDWSYEKEWRVMVSKKSRDDSLFEYISMRLSNF